MIQDIFLPEKIRDYYIFSQKVVGIDITKSHIYATLFKIQGATRSVEKQVIEPLNGDANYADRVKEKLSQVMSAIGKVDQIRTAISSTQVIFKELRMPFTTYEKISLVIRFEVEPLLPFPAQEAIIDFIITHINEEEKTAQILVAAVQKQNLVQHLSLFEQAGINPSAVTVDMIGLYGLFTQIPPYNVLSDAVIIIDLDMQSTRIVAIDNHQLRIIRSLPYGLATSSVKDGNASLKPVEIVDHLIRFGIDDKSTSDKNQALTNNITTYFNKVQFALNSTLPSLQSQNISKVLLSGPGAEVKDIASFAQTIFQLPCEIFNGHLLTENKHYHINKSITATPASLISVATALLCPPIDEFNLMKEEFAPATRSLLLKQIIVASILIVTLFGSLITHTIIQTSRLKHEINNSQTEVITVLKERFPEIPEEEEVLEDIIDFAKSELKKEEDVWMAFSSQARASFLEYLLELSTHINKQQLGFVPEQLTIVEGPIAQITLKAKVRENDFEALKQLERALRQSKLFSYVSEEQKTDFTMKITVAHNI